MEPEIGINIIINGEGKKGHEATKTGQNLRN